MSALAKKKTTGSHRSEFGLSGTPPSGTLNVFVMTPYQLATIIVWYQFVFFSRAAHLMVIKTFPCDQDDDKLAEVGA